MSYDQIIRELHVRANAVNVAGMARFGINPDNALGVSVRELRGMAKGLGRNHDLALRLWESGIHEARIAAALIDSPDRVTEEQMEKWAADFDSWDICDLTCNNLFRLTPFAYLKVHEWSRREGEFVKRAGFVLMATLSVHDKKAGHDPFLGFLALIESQASDGRNYVKKAVNWALRQIGKRNGRLNRAAVETALRIRDLGPGSARWIGSDALRELRHPKILAKIKILN